MDDSRFDDIIKEKIGNYEDPVFDPSALSALQHQMSAIVKLPWYSRYRTELIAGAAVVLSMLIVLLNQYEFNTREIEMKEKFAALVQAQQDTIDKLQRQISYLRTLPPDTIEITTGNNYVAAHNDLIQRIALLEFTIEKMKTGLAEQERSVSSTESSALIENQDYDIADTDAILFRKRIVPAQKKRTSLRVIPGEHSFTKGSREIQLSVNTIRNLEKHYRQGMGIRLGPVVELSKGFYTGAESRVDITAGVLGDFIVSPSLSLETGAKFIHRFYEVPGDKIGSRKMPFVNDDLTPIVSADIDSWILEIPVHLKYRYPLSMKKYLVGGAGYSALIYTKQSFEYDYAIDNHPSATINESHAVAKSTFYPGTINISLGLSNQLRNKKVLETSLYYQHGIGLLGREKTKGGFLGLKAGYWFTVR